ncbi:MAG: hypothetical protein ACK5HY_07545, partial [Parahaliea sp.]
MPSSPYAIDREWRALDEGDPRGVYRIVLHEAGELSWRLEALPLRRQLRDRGCLSLTLDSLGLRGASPGDVAGCW